MAQVSVFSPWRDASHLTTGVDQSVAFRVKCIADVGPAGGQVTGSTITVAGAAITIQIAEGGGALANDAGIAYTGQTGGVGVITLGDANVGTIMDVINILNGVGVGQAAIRRYRAAIGDVRPDYPLTAGAEINALAAANILLGEYHPGLAELMDTSALVAAAPTDAAFVGIGTNQGTIAGSGWLMPDYFEDIPGSSTTASVNLPLRSAARMPRKSEGATTRRKQYRITGFSARFLHATTEQFDVYDIWNNLIYSEVLTNNVVTLFQDRSDTPIVGPVGSPLFCQLGGTGGETDGAFSVQAEERSV